MIVALVGRVPLALAVHIAKRNRASLVTYAVHRIDCTKDLNARLRKAALSLDLQAFRPERRIGFHFFQNFPGHLGRRGTGYPIGERPTASPPYSRPLVRSRPLSAQPCNQHDHRSGRDFVGRGGYKVRVGKGALRSVDGKLRAARGAGMDSKCDVAADRLSQ